MAILFTITDNMVYPFPETLLVSPFKEIWERDTDPAKHIALQEFAYIEFMGSMKKTNTFRTYPEMERHDKIVEVVMTDKDWMPDSLVLNGIKVIDDLKKGGSMSYSYYLDAVVGLNKVKKFLRTVDLDERTKSGSPVFKAKEVTSTLLDTEKLLMNFEKLLKKIDEEDFEETKNRGGAVISPFANPDVMRD